MKLLLDENISRRVLPLLAAAYPGSSHVILHGLQQAKDVDIWQFAEDEDFVVVSRDEDFTALSGLRGRPPCLIKLSIGNCDNERLARALLLHHDQIAAQFADTAVAMVELIAEVR